MGTYGNGTHTNCKNFPLYLLNILLVLDNKYYKVNHFWFLKNEIAS